MLSYFRKRMKEHTGKNNAQQNQASFTGIQSCYFYTQGMIEKRLYISFFIEGKITIKSGQTNG